ncbi:MAG TPA: DUF4340 domain-containing protein, partial [Bacteroidota bacterium]
MRRPLIILLGILVLCLIVAVILLRQPGEVSSSGTTGDTIARFDSASIDRIEIRGRTGAAVLEKQADGWMLIAPMRYQADPAAVAEALSRARRSEVKNIVSTNPAKQSLFDVDTSGTLVTLSGGGASEAFRVGKTSPSFTETYVRREGSNDVLLVDGLLSSVFARAPGEWRDRTIFSAPMGSITSVGFHFGDTAFVLTLADSLWKVDGAAAQGQAVQTFLAALSSLQADTFVDTAVASMPRLTCTIEVQGTRISFFWNAAASRYDVVTSRSPQIFTL